MIKRILYLSAILILFFTKSLFASQKAWQSISSLTDLDLYSVALSPNNPDIFYVGSNRAIFKTIDAGNSFQEVLSIKGERKRVNYLVVTSKITRLVSAATQNGFFYSRDSGVTWVKIFDGLDEKEKNCLFINATFNKFYLGTHAGLFYSKDRGRTWHKEKGKLGQARIVSIRIDNSNNKIVYVATSDKVFRSVDAGLSWQCVFTITGQDQDTEETSQTDTDYILDDETGVSGINFLAMDTRNCKNLYLATNKGVYASFDKAKTWNKFTDSGFINNNTRFILVSKIDSQVYAATGDGVYVYLKEKWQKIFQGLTAQNVRAVAQDIKGNLIAATDRGLFKTQDIENVQFLASEKEEQNLAMEKKIIDQFKDEPTIREVQGVAIKYAEVHPDKIKEWRRQAKVKAILPTLSAGVGRDVTDFYHWESGSTTRTGDDVLIKGNDILEWDVNLSWDLGELIWNNDQTSIDTRSRLMVQLREDILDQVTRLYFERRRLQIDLFMNPPDDQRARIERQLRIEELAASIDALTGGYFSKKIDETTT